MPNENSKKLVINPKIFELFPDVLIGVVVLQGVDNHGHNEEIIKMLQQGSGEVLSKINKMSVAEHPNVAPWREAYRKFGTKPSDYPSSIENLIRRVLRGEQLRSINKLVDIYNVISLKHLIPAGGEDTDKIKGNVSLTFASANESPVLLLGEKEARQPHENEVIYKDDVGTLCRRWNWKEAERTKLTEQTTNAFMVLEALPPIGRTELEVILGDLESLVRACCGGNIATTVLDRSNLETVIGE